MRKRLTKAILSWLLFRWRRHDTPAWSCNTWFWNVIGQDWLLWSGAFISRYLNIVIRRSAYSIAVVRLFKPCRRGAWLWIDKNSICVTNGGSHSATKVQVYNALHLHFPPATQGIRVLVDRALSERDEAIFLSYSVTNVATRDISSCYVSHWSIVLNQTEPPQHRLESRNEGKAIINT